MNTKMLVVNRWVRWLHIYSAVPVLLSMIFFAVTGFFLNHTDWNLGQTKQYEQSFELPENLTQMDWQDSPSLYALTVLNWLDREHNVRGIKMEFEWDEDEPLLAIVLDSPHGNQSIEVFPDEGVVEVFTLSLPLLVMLNNVHRGKSVSDFWRLLSDLSAIFMLVFCVTGLWLVLINKVQRLTSSAWVTLGSVVFFLSLYLMH
ncbi:hypothetical protein DN062_05175 [Nitrincola tibetensis]|uniref:Peptidase n=1 Tax=Nitrincola tibetensis TaxID=2219697 RepID=A0A364NP49_9GAMM|nr:PepSY-associated TM helix domain-containing protein [Nitrincola tibetensis]RAU18876.1 hypothetical protein DN062_05175 [Nitrincola tibetensis]